ncbi:hypothetical protein CRM22_002297 [Opisthorchis felineus]|uniref:Uncharacterized protein n=1 Tax=Opisthorchis felineus TaxID=147828 RepID=A0A4S2M6P3_OPIFE|nr:hypothetical protein CRM22_002297 [Opisthorchis felineus]
MQNHPVQPAKDENPPIAGPPADTLREPEESNTSDRNLTTCLLAQVSSPKPTNLLITEMASTFDKFLSKFQELDQPDLEDGLFPTTDGDATGPPSSYEKQLRVALDRVGLNMDDYENAMRNLSEEILTSESVFEENSDQLNENKTEPPHVKKKLDLDEGDQLVPFPVDPVGPTSESDMCNLLLYDCNAWDSSVSTKQNQSISSKNSFQKSFGDKRIEEAEKKKWAYYADILEKKTKWEEYYCEMTKENSGTRYWWNVRKEKTDSMERIQTSETEEETTSPAMTRELEQQLEVETKRLEERIRELEIARAREVERLKRIQQIKTDVRLSRHCRSAGIRLGDKASLLQSASQLRDTSLQRPNTTDGVRTSPLRNTLEDQIESKSFLCIPTGVDEAEPDSPTCCTNSLRWLRSPLNSEMSVKQVGTMPDLQSGGLHWFGNHDIKHPNIDSNPSLSSQATESGSPRAVSLQREHDSTDPSRSFDGSSEQTTSVSSTFMTESFPTLLDEESFRPQNPSTVVVQLAVPGSLTPKRVAPHSPHLSMLFTKKVDVPVEEIHPFSHSAVPNPPSTAVICGDGIGVTDLLQSADDQQGLKNTQRLKSQVACVEKQQDYSEVEMIPNDIREQESILYETYEASREKTTLLSSKWPVEVSRCTPTLSGLHCSNDSVRLQIHNEESHVPLLLVKPISLPRPLRHALALSPDQVDIKLLDPCDNPNCKSYFIKIRLDLDPWVQSFEELSLRIPIPDDIVFQKDKSLRASASIQSHFGVHQQFSQLFTSNSSKGFYGSADHHNNARETAEFQEGVILETSQHNNLTVDVSLGKRSVKTLKELKAAGATHCLAASASGVEGNHRILHSSHTNPENAHPVRQDNLKKNSTETAPYWCIALRCDSLNESEEAVNGNILDFTESGNCSSQACSDRNNSHFDADDNFGILSTLNRRHRNDQNEQHSLLRNSLSQNPVVLFKNKQKLTSKTTNRYHPTSSDSTRERKSLDQQGREQQITSHCDQRIPEDHMLVALRRRWLNLLELRKRLFGGSHAQNMELQAIRSPENKLRPQGTLHQTNKNLSEQVVSKALGVKEIPGDFSQQILCVEFFQISPGCDLVSFLWKCLELKVLRLHGCNLTTSCLKGIGLLKNLELLDLSKNCIDGLEVDTFALPKLTALDLCCNRISTLTRLGGPYTALKELNVSTNLITRLDRDQLHFTAPQLFLLDVSNNLVTQLGSSNNVGNFVFPLGSIILSGNQLMRLEDFTCVDYVATQLDLSSNLLQELPAIGFHGPILKKLILDQNGLLSLDSLVESWLPNLVELSANRNSITTLPRIHCPSLQYFLLQDNRISDISNLAEMLNLMPALCNLDLKNNPCTIIASHRKPSHFDALISRSGNGRLRSAANCDNKVETTGPYLLDDHLHMNRSPHLVSEEPHLTPPTVRIHVSDYSDEFANLSEYFVNLACEKTGVRIQIEHFAPTANVIEKHQILLDDCVHNVLNDYKNLIPEVYFCHVGQTGKLSDEAREQLGYSKEFGSANPDGSTSSVIMGESDGNVTVPRKVDEPTVSSNAYQKGVPEDQTEEPSKKSMDSEKDLDCSIARETSVSSSYFTDGNEVPSWINLITTFRCSTRLEKLTRKLQNISNRIRFLATRVVRIRMGMQLSRHLKLLLLPASKTTCSNTGQKCLRRTRQ